MRIPLSRLTLSTAMGMVDGVHDDSANMRTLTLPPGPAGLADTHIFVIDIANLANRRHKIGRAHV